MLSMWSCGSCWRGIEINTSGRHAWEYNERMMSKSFGNQNLRLERSQSKRFQHARCKVFLRNRAAWAQPLASTHHCALLLCILLLGNRSCSAIGQCCTGPTNKQPTINELPMGNCPVQLLVSTQWALPTGNCQWGTTREVIQSRVSGAVMIWLLTLRTLLFFFF